MSRKKEIELEIFERVYSVVPSHAATQTENPDVEVQLRNGTRFGVEITTLYPSEMDARLRWDKRYFDRVVTDRRKIHKDDQLQVFSVITGKEGPNGEVEPASGLIMPVPKIAQHREMLADVIEEKGVSFGHYDASLEWIDLVILDQCATQPPHFSAAYSVPALIGSDRLRTAIHDSPFREINLLAYDDTGILGYRPLRVLAFQEIMHITQAALAESGHISCSAEEYLTVFGEVAGICGYDFDQVNIAGSPAAHWNDHYVRVNPDTGGAFVEDAMIDPKWVTPSHRPVADIAFGDVVMRKARRIRGKREFITSLRFNVQPFPQKRPPSPPRQS